ncbi:excalibur calcium-binding domain-containing protein [Arthrobacter sp. 2RAF6]|uniref:excalibur calcium-binding domain-containing protein n=1 Tax=Arthrobacter sp. 2RAF6 TaxID=3233002 RepID=UPI003F8E9B17
MNTRAPKNNGELKHAPHDFLKSRKAGFKVFAIVTSTAAALSLAACGGASPTLSHAGATQSASASASATPTPTPTPTPTAPKSVSCVTENATESYSPKEYVCTKSDAGTLVWMERSESKRVTDARAAAAAAAAKAAADKAAADKAAADKAAADKAAADAAAAQAAAQAKAEADAAAVKAQQDQAQARQVQPVAPSSVYYANCTAARAAGAAPIYRGQPGYRPALDRDGDGIACE